MPYGFLDHALHTDAVAKAHLQFGWMHVDVDVLGSNRDPEIDRWPVARMDGGAVSRLCRAQEERVLEGTAVHEELSASPRRLRIAGTLHVTFDPEGSRRVGNRHQCPCDGPAPHRGEPLLGQSVPAGTVSRVGAIDLQVETGLRMGERQGRDGLVRGASLAGSGAEKFPAGWRVEEERANRHRRAAAPHRVGDAVESSAADGELGAGAVLLRTW